MTFDFNLDDLRYHEEASRWLAVPPRVARILEQRARHQQDLAHPDPKLVASERGGLRGHLCGEIGEWSVAHRLGLRLHELHDSGGDGHVDFQLPEGHTLAVRATEHLSDWLLFRTLGHFTTDLAALVYVRIESGDPDRYLACVQGWILALAVSEAMRAIRAGPSRHRSLRAFRRTQSHRAVGSVDR